MSAFQELILPSLNSVMLYALHCQDRMALITEQYCKGQNKKMVKEHNNTIAPYIILIPVPLSLSLFLSDTHSLCLFLLVLLYLFFSLSVYLSLCVPSSLPILNLLSVSLYLSGNCLTLSASLNKVSLVFLRSFYAHEAGRALNRIRNESLHQ